MSKIAEKKALEEYPKINHPYSTDVEREIDAKRAYYRTAYIVGYDQAFQDFLKKSEIYLKTRVYYNMHPNNVTIVMQEFKKYMQNESEN